MDWDAHNSAISKRQSLRNQIVNTQAIDQFGQISQFKRPRGEDVVLVETLWGGHNQIGLQESVIDIIGTMFEYKVQK